MGGKLKASVALAIMFSLGVLAGYSWRDWQAERESHQAFATRRVERLKRDLHLTEDQQKAIQDIFARAHERAQQVNEEVSWDLQDIRRQSVDAIKQVLTPEQNKTFETMHKRRHHRSGMKEAKPNDSPKP